MRQVARVQRRSLKVAVWVVCKACKDLPPRVAANLLPHATRTAFNVYWQPDPAHAQCIKMQLT